MQVPRRTQTIIAALSLSLCTLAAGSSAADSRRSIEITPQTKFVWSCYMICFALNRDFTGDFYDRPLDRPPADGSSPRLVDLRNAVNAGFDGLSVDLFIEDKYALPTFRQLVDLVNQHNLPIGLSPMFDGFSHPGIAVDQVVAKVKAWFTEFAHEPCVVRCDGKPVLLTYAPYALKPDQWREILAQLHAAGCDAYWVGEYGRYFCLGTEPQFTAARPWMDLFPGANTFPPMPPARTRALLDQYRQTYPAGVWVGSARIGYWRPEVAVYTSEDGTAAYRDSWQTITDAGINWVQQATWNDFSENHNVMPSENYSTTFCDLNRYLVRQWKGLPPDLDGPKLYLSQQSEVCTGETAQFELLTMLRPQDVPARLTFELTDSAGAVEKTFDAATVDKPGLHATEFTLPVKRIPAGRLLFPRATLQCTAAAGDLTIRGPHTIVSEGGYRPKRNHSWLHTPADRQLRDARCVLTLDGHTGGSLDQADTKGAASVQVTSPVALADVEILHNGVQVFSMRQHSPKVSLRSPFTGSTALPLDRRGLLDWGAYAARAITTDGRTVTSLPVFVERPAAAGVTVGLWTFDHDTTSDVLDSSPWLHDGRLGGRTRYEVQRPAHAPDPWGGKCLSFDGIDDRVLLEGPVVPPNTYTVECWINWAGFTGNPKPGNLIIATANAAVVLSINAGGRLLAARHSDGGWYGVEDTKPLEANHWHHVAVTYDGNKLSLFRDGVLARATSAPGDSKCGQVSIGYNSVTNGSFYHGLIDEVRVSARVLTPNEFGPHNPLRVKEK